uniref:Alpha-1,6-mannosyl-glycoprotein 2-beta-N-acetylglucosaminyltransferase n=1 Tax=Panagrellus redivivus TaxID=6233 RepID=A0A7E4V047_PANRE
MIPRRRTITFSRVLICVGALAVFCVCTLLMGNAAPTLDDLYPLPKLNLTSSDPAHGFIVQGSLTTQKQHEFTLPQSLNSSKYDSNSTWADLFQPPPAYSHVLNSIDYLNTHHEVRNEAKFGNPSNASFVIVVQVHQRIEYLKLLIDTLRHAVGIEEALLVFSHDLYDEAINDVVREIDFCRVIQIFYPTNIQIFANVFPGTDPDDCVPRETVAKANETKCGGYDHPDTYGHYRLGSLSQIKHHWWWKMNYVYDGIMKRYGLTKHYVVLLEEDHYVSPDFVHVMKQMVKDKDTFCPTCQVLCLGFYLKNYNSYATNTNKLAIHPWFSSKHNMAMAINGDTWEKIRNCAKFFCTYDDYNWDWSLLQLSVKCLPTRLKVVVAKSPRVIHVGDCGVHTHRCNKNSAANNAKALFAHVASSLFPTQLKVSEISSRTLKPSKPNGGWGDIRDQGLCLANTARYRPLADNPASGVNINMSALFEPPILVPPPI